MSIMFTSFERSTRYLGEKFAICEHQPQHFNYPELTFFAPTNAEGKPVRSSDYFKRPKGGPLDPHEFYEAVDAYRKDLMAGFCNNMTEIGYWLKAITPKDDLVLCCWCPQSRSSKQQIKDLGVMACHSGILAEVLTMCRPDITVVLDVDRSERLVPQWQFGQLEQSSLFPQL
jgi:hypothetical protein